jgi:glycosyltransferase involved in cell wall biosynthesis
LRPLLIDLGKDYRGGQHQALLLLQGLLQRGHKPQLLALAGSGLAKDAQLSGIPTRVVPASSRQIRSAGAIRELLAEHRSDIVHANEPHALTAAWIARAHRRVPLAVSRRVIFPLSRSPISMARYRAAAKVIAISHCVEKALLGSGLSTDRIAIIPDGVRISNLKSPDLKSNEVKIRARQTFGIRTDVPLVGNVAAFTPDKGQASLVHALTAVRGSIPECQLLLAGEGPCRAEVESLAATNGLKNAVHFVGYVDDIDRVYEAVDVFAFPAQAEALGTALLLAMSYDLPVVALARGGVPEAVEDGRNGLLVQSLEGGALAGAIVRLLSEPDEALRLGQRARETICERYSVDRMVETTIGLYEELISSSAR